MTLLAREPVALAGALDGLTKATIAVLIGFDIVHWTDAQTALVLVLETSVIGFVMAIVRMAVTPVNPPPDDEYHPPA